MKNTFVPLVAVLAISFVFGSGATANGASADKQAASEAVVTIDNFTFTPADITVQAGTTVRWTNRDDIPHSVVSDDKVFKSKALDTDEQFSYTFNKPGTYRYFCGLHPKMTAKVVAQ
jgi:plastocyanin